MPEKLGELLDSPKSISEEVLRRIEAISVRYKRKSAAFETNAFKLDTHFPWVTVIINKWLSSLL
jgi:hypothetical protein